MSSMFRVGMSFSNLHRCRCSDIRSPLADALIRTVVRSVAGRRWDHQPARKRACALGAVRACDILPVSINLSRVMRSLFVSPIVFCRFKRYAPSESGYSATQCPSASNPTNPADTFRCSKAARHITAWTKATSPGWHACRPFRRKKRKHPRNG